MDTKSIQTGVIGGLAGGLAFGAMMGMMGMLPMVAMLVGSESAMVGFLVHMVNSAIIGGIFAVTLGSRAEAMTGALQMGLAYGIIWWILGPLLIMPVALGVGPQLSPAGIQGAIPSLFGHLIFGAILGASYPLLLSRGELATEEVEAEEEDEEE